METPVIETISTPQILEKRLELAKEGLGIVIKKIEEERIRRGEPNSVTVYEREYPLRVGSEIDSVVANAQSFHRSAQEVLANVRGADYYQEEGAAKLEELLGIREDYIRRHTELLEHFPTLAQDINKMLPNFSPDNNKKYLVQ